MCSPIPDHPTCLEYTGREDLYRTPLFREGAYELQDVASQAVGWLCDPQPKERWWDACAGAGGKTLQLSDGMQNTGLIWATDRSARRLSELKRRAGRAGVFNYRSSRWVKPEEIPVRTQFEGVLLDAPCSGVGTWQRNPHARWMTGPEEVERLWQTQLVLLRQAAQRVRPGGKLVYSVCTLTDLETKGVVEKSRDFLKEFDPLPLRSPFTEEDRAGEAAGVTLWPHQSGGDGMFVAAWRRR